MLCVFEGDRGGMVARYSPSQQHCTLSARLLRPLSRLQRHAAPCRTHASPGTAPSYSEQAGAGSISHF